jgi:hypothetical protein
MISRLAPLHEAAPRHLLDEAELIEHFERGSMGGRRARIVVDPCLCLE